MPRTLPRLLLFSFLGLLPCCSNSTPAEPPHYVDVTDASGIDFRHVHGGSGEMYFIETNGSGCGFFDYDLDGDLDLYLVQAGALPGFEAEGPLTNILYRNDGGLHFTDVTDAAGVGDAGYGMGCVMPDIDGDGDQDLFVFNWGENVMYRNDGDGTFTDVTRAAGLQDAGYGGTASFADFDADGDLDLFLGNYVTFRIDEHKPCVHPPLERSYCHPDVYPAQPDRFYRNEGNGRFTEVSREVGITRIDGKALGAVISDVDGDGDLDLFVANDSSPNHLYRNDSTPGRLRFTDISDAANISYDQAGRTQGSMGVDFGDIDNDLDFDLIVTNFMWETNALYVNDGTGMFEDECMRRGIGQVSYLDFGWGTRFFDFDHDGDQDLLVVNGHLHGLVHIYDEAQQYEQPARLFFNDGQGRFENSTRQAGSFFAEKLVARGLALADLDDDGDLDAFITTNNHSVHLLECQGATANHWVGFELHGAGANPDAIGAHLLIQAGGRSQVQEVRGATSFASMNDLRVLFGLGDAAQVEFLEVRWPDGLVERFAVESTDRYHHLEQGEGQPAPPE